MTETPQENRYVGVYEDYGHEDVTDEDRALLKRVNEKNRVAREKQTKRDIVGAP